MDVSAQLSQLAIVSAAVFSFIEFLKPYIELYFAPLVKMADRTKQAIYRLLNVIFCVGIVISSNNTLNLFIDNPFLGVQLPFFGMLITGIATGLGSTFLNFIAGWATLRFITIPKVEALKVKAQTMELLTDVPEDVEFIEDALRAEKI